MTGDLWITAASGGLTGVNLVVISRFRKYRKERQRRDANWTTQAHRQDPGPGEDPRPAQQGADTRTAEEASPGLEVLEQDDPIRAWKAVRLQADDSTVWLASGHTGELVGPPAQAVCRSHYYPLSFSDAPTRPPHGAVPDLNCTCGWYALKDRSEAFGSVLAEVDLYGTVIEAERGYRAEWQRVLALHVVGEICTGGFLCPEKPDLLDFPEVETTTHPGGGAPVTMRVRLPRPVCRLHATGDYTVGLDRVASRLGVEVRWLDGGRDG